MAQQKQQQVMQLNTADRSKKSSVDCRNDGRIYEEEKKITSQFDNDPIAKLRSRELDLRAQENQRKEREGKRKNGP